MIEPGTSDYTSERVKHLEMIQAIIARMNRNSFTLKAFAGTITAAVLAFAGSANNPASWLPLAGLAPVVTFWLLDAKYLWQERCFVKLYGAAANGEVKPFDMNFLAYKKDVASVGGVAMSWSVFWYYAALAIVLNVLWIVL